MTLVVVDQAEEHFLDLILAANYTLKLYKTDVTAGLTQVQQDALDETDFTVPESTLSRPSLVQRTSPRRSSMATMWSELRTASCNGLKTSSFRWLSNSTASMFKSHPESHYRTRGTDG
jgi:hypothetical protein